MANITVCGKCGRAYAACSEEMANHPVDDERLCPRCANGGLPCRYVIHHADADGKCAAAIVGRNRRHAFQVVYLPMRTYSDPVPCVEGFGFREGMDEIWIVDFSFPPEVMAVFAEVAGHSRFFWFDHHKSVLSHAQTALDGLMEEFV